MAIDFPGLNLTETDWSKFNPYKTYQESQSTALANALNEFKRQSEAARAPYYGRMAEAETKKAEAEPEEILARALQARTEAKYTPTKYKIEQMNAETRRGELGARTSNSFRQWSQTPEGQKIIQNDPEMAKAIYNAIQTSAAGYGYKPPSEANTPEEHAVAQTVKDQNQKVTPKDMVKQIQTAAQDQYEKQNLPADTKKRLYAGHRFKATIPMVKDNLRKASVYFSPQGQIKLKEDQTKAAAEKRVPPELQAYRNLMQDLEQMSLLGANLEGVPADQLSRGAYHKIWDAPTFFNSPQDAEQYIDHAINLGLVADSANRSTLSEITSDTGEQSATPETAAPATPSGGGKKGDTYSKWENGKLVKVNK